MAGSIRIICAIGFLLANCLAAQTSAPPAKLQSKQGEVDYSKAATTNWNSANVGQAVAHYDRVRTRALSEAALQLVDFSVVRLAELSLLEMMPPREAAAKARFHFQSGKMYFIDRLKPREVEIQTQSAVAAILGTEFHLIVDANGRTELNLIDGKVELSNPLGSVTLDSGDRGIAVPGQAPIKETAVLKGTNIVQWYMYYPGVLDLDELGLTPLETQTLSASLGAYRAGDLLAAFTNYPAGRVNISSGEAGYQANLLLAFGRLTNTANLPAALRWVLSAVLQETNPPVLPATNASQLLGKSYYLQSTYDLEGALKAAQQAVTLSPRFGFGWARVAELEFSFGRNHKARAALQRALALSPRNAQAHALQGFILLGNQQTTESIMSFETALQIDKRLANAWLGRGLARFQRRQFNQGRADIQTATAMEPNRWLLRSYLAKAYSADPRLTEMARKELALGRAMDPRDPTPWLYSALLNHQEHRIGEAITDLEQSVALNDNRRVYRSRLLLDQDLAVRSARLANIYDSAAMPEVSLHESSRAVVADYGNFSAHANLAASFNAFRDPTRFDLRYETEWFNELLLANLMSRVGAGNLSQTVSQQEYSRAFLPKRFGVSTSTEYFSDGEFRQLASQFGTFSKTSYALDLEYQHKEGNEFYNDLSRLEWYTRIKQQLSPANSLFLLTKYQDYESEDNLQYYDPASQRRDFTFTETQLPLALAGFHHEWSPGVHTLFLGGRLVNEQRLRERGTDVALFEVSSNLITFPGSFTTNAGGLDLDLRTEFETYTAELNQIIQRESHIDVFGARYQRGWFESRARMDNPQPPNIVTFPDPASQSEIDSDFERISAYAYHTWKPLHQLWLTAGLAYDVETVPRNFRNPPLTGGEETRDKLSPKVSVIWSPAPLFTLRMAYAQALGGASYDESVRLEPTHLAGFGQSFRSVISESLIGSVEAPEYEAAYAAIDFQFPTRTYLSFQAQSLTSEIDRTIGIFDYQFAGVATPASTRDQIDYQEWGAKVVLNQILADEWFLEAKYQFTRSDLDRTFPDLVTPAIPAPSTDVQADLHEVRLGLLYRHPSGVFARAESWWLWQKNHGYSPSLEGDDVFQANFFVGYRFRRERGDITIGVLNIADEDYRLNPLTPYVDLPRERLFYARLRLNL